MSKEEVQKIATQAGFGTIHFQFNIARNTGESFEVGYLIFADRKELFCKRKPRTAETEFYLCNDFAKLIPIY